MSALSNEIVRLREFIRSSRAIVQEYATTHPKYLWQGAEQDPMGAHAWLEREAAEVGTMADGGDPKRENRPLADQPLASGK